MNVKWDFVIEAHLALVCVSQRKREREKRNALIRSSARPTRREKLRVVIDFRLSQMAFERFGGLKASPSAAD